MKIQELFKDIRYIGRAEGDRKTYHVFGASNSYLIVGPMSQGYALNIVDSEAPEVIARAFKRKKVTSTLVRKSARRPDLFPNSLASLGSLYVMVAQGRARKLKQRQGKGKAMVFKVSG